MDGYGFGLLIGIVGLIILGDEYSDPAVGLSIFLTGVVIIASRYLLGAEEIAIPIVIAGVGLMIIKTKSDDPGVIGFCLFFIGLGNKLVALL